MRGALNPQYGPEHFLGGATAYANTKNADLFISIHVNAHRNRRAYGLETYYLNLATDDESIRVAARENARRKKTSVICIPSCPI